NAERSPGLKRGGVLNVVRHELELECASTAIPDKIVVDLTGYNIGDSIHISAVKLPEGARSTITDRDFTVATIVAPSGLKSEEAAATEESGETA
ncbi:MAG TPA: 50S ribosomal protein L25, partial [Arenibaculum sp.]|nr:50S ribosomal protein L25 [Arenibaculum sp.]